MRAGTLHTAKLAQGEGESEEGLLLVKDGQ
jgi:hypothetical protein